MLLSNTDPGKPTTLSSTRAFQNDFEHCREKQGEKIGNEESLQTFWLTQTWPATQASLLLPEPLTKEAPRGLAQLLRPDSLTCDCLLLHGISHLTTHYPDILIYSQ